MVGDSSYSNSYFCGINLGCDSIMRKNVGPETQLDENY